MKMYWLHEGVHPEKFLSNERPDDFFKSLEYPDPFVLHSDVIALEQDNKRLRRALKAITGLYLCISSNLGCDGYKAHRIAQEALKVKP